MSKFFDQFQLSSNKNKYDELNALVSEAIEGDMLAKQALQDPLFREYRNKKI